MTCKVQVLAVGQHLSHLHLKYWTRGNIKWCSRNMQISSFGLLRMKFWGQLIVHFEEGKLFGTKFVVKYETEILKIGWQIRRLNPKIFLNRKFSVEKKWEREVIIFFWKKLEMNIKCHKKKLPEIKIPSSQVCVARSESLWLWIVSLDNAKSDFGHKVLICT